MSHSDSVMNFQGIYPCQVCGMDFDGEYFEFSKEKNKDVYKCYKCNGLNFFSPVMESDEEYVSTEEDATEDI